LEVNHCFSNDIRERRGASTFGYFFDEETDIFTVSDDVIDDHRGVDKGDDGQCQHPGFVGKTGSFIQEKQNGDGREGKEGIEVNLRSDSNGDSGQKKVAIAFCFEYRDTTEERIEAQENEKGKDVWAPGESSVEDQVNRAGEKGKESEGKVFVEVSSGEDIKERQRQNREEKHEHGMASRGVSEDEGTHILEVVECWTETECPSATSGGAEERQFANAVVDGLRNDTGIIGLVDFEKEPVGKIIGTKKNSQEYDTPNNEQFPAVLSTLFDE
jgi:hypothetical protein